MVGSTCVKVSIVGEHTHEDNRARDGEGHAEYETTVPIPAETVRHERAHHGGYRALPERTRDRYATHRQQLVEMELKPDAEHQQDDPDLGHLLGKMLVGHEARRIRADEHSREQVPDDWRETKPMCDVSAR